MFELYFDVKHTSIYSTKKTKSILVRPVRRGGAPVINLVSIDAAWDCLSTSQMLHKSSSLWAI